MGWNTTIVVMNDALHAIARDSKFGEKLERACLMAVDGESVDVGANPDGTESYYVNAATVIETHHADGTALVAVGGNMGVNLGVFYAYGEEDKDVRLLKALADKLGYQISKKVKKVKK